MRFTTVESDDGFSGRDGGSEEDMDVGVAVVVCAIGLDVVMEDARPVHW